MRCFNRTADNFPLQNRRKVMQIVKPARTAPETDNHAVGTRIKFKPIICARKAYQKVTMAESGSEPAQPPQTGLSLKHYINLFKKRDIFFNMHNSLHPQSVYRERRPPALAYFHTKGESHCVFRAGLHMAHNEPLPNGT